MLAAGAKLAYQKDQSVGWLCIFVVISSAATVYQLYWDFVKDWGLFQMNSKNPGLRNELMLRTKAIYYFSMVYKSGPFLSIKSVSPWIKIGTQMLECIRISVLIIIVQVKANWTINVRNKNILKMNYDKAIKMRLLIYFKEINIRAIIVFQMLSKHYSRKLGFLFRL